MSPVFRTGREKFVDVLARNSTFKKGYHNDLNYYHGEFKIQSGADSMPVTTIELLQLSVAKMARY
jgi:hypothetical protein